MRSEMNKFESFILKIIFKRLVKQGWSQGENITRVYSLLKDAATLEFSEDSELALGVFLQERFELSQGNLKGAYSLTSALTEKDAKRYRWLRDVGDTTYTPFGAWGTPIEELEEYIDTQIGEEEYISYHGIAVSRHRREST